MTEICVNDGVKRRSSILKMNRNGESSDGSPPQYRRVSFAGNMKVKTFDETGCNTSEIVPHPDASGSCDMSLVNTTISCDNGSVDMELSNVSKHSVVSNTNGANGRSGETAEPAPSGTATIPKDNGTEISDSSSDSDRDETGEILNQQVRKSILPSDLQKGGEPPESEEQTGDVLKQLNSITLTRESRIGCIKTGTSGKNDTSRTRLGDSFTDTLPPLPSGVLNDPVLIEIYKQRELLRKEKKETKAQMERMKHLTADIEKEAADLVASLKNRPRLFPWKN